MPTGQVYGMAQGVGYVNLHTFAAYFSAGLVGGTIVATIEESSASY